MTNTRLGVAALFACLLALTSCSSSKSRVGGVFSLDTDLKLVFEVKDDLNPDAQQQPSPVFLRLYELEDPRAFEKADFIDLYEKDDAVLGDSLVAKQSIKRFVPGEERTEHIVLKPSTRYVGLYAEFLQYQDANYKVVFQVTKNNVIRNVATIRMTGNKISIAEK